MAQENTETRYQLEDNLNGIAAANHAVETAAPGSSIIFLTRSEYQDLLARAYLPELKSYKGKYIVVVSDVPTES